MGSTHAGAGDATAIVGLTDRESIERGFPAWAQAARDAHPDVALAAQLAEVEPGAEVDVFLGTWCGDSRREVGRFFVALESVEGPLPFALRFIGVDRAKEAPGFSEGAELLFVPTFIVRRGGVEVGRVIESAPEGVERAVLDLLRGARTGIISGRDDL